MGTNQTLGLRVDAELFSAHVIRHWLTVEANLSALEGCIVVKITTQVVLDRLRHNFERIVLEYQSWLEERV